MDNNITKLISEDVKLAKKLLAKNAESALKSITRNELLGESEDMATIDEVEVEDETTKGDEMTSDDSTETGMDSDEDSSTEDIEDEMGKDSDEDSSTEEIELGGDDFGSDDIEMIDLTDSDDEEILAIYKKLNDEDSIKVVDTGDSLELDVKETGEYIIKNEEGESDEDEMTDNFEASTEDEMTDDTEFEIDEDELATMLENVLAEEMSKMLNKDNKPKPEITEEDIMSELENVMEQGETTESSSMCEEGSDEAMVSENEDEINEVKSVEMHPNKLLHPNSVNEGVSKEKYDSLLTQYEKVKTTNKEIVENVNKLRGMLHEAVLTNASLTYAVKLFTENAVTKNEKKEILESFDSAKGVEEAKTIFESYNKKLSEKVVIKEKVDVQLDSSKTIIEEKATYTHPDVKKFMSIIKEVEKLR